MTLTVPVNLVETFATNFMEFIADFTDVLFLEDLPWWFIGNF